MAWEPVNRCDQIWVDSSIPDGPGARVTKSMLADMARWFAKVNVEYNARLGADYYFLYDERQVIPPLFLAFYQAGAIPFAEDRALRLREGKTHNGRVDLWVSTGEHGKIVHHIEVKHVRLSPAGSVRDVAASRWKTALKDVKDAAIEWDYYHKGVERVFKTVLCIVAFTQDSPPDKSYGPISRNMLRTRVDALRYAMNPVPNWMAVWSLCEDHQIAWEDNNVLSCTPGIALLAHVHGPLQYESQW